MSMRVAWLSLGRPPHTPWPLLLARALLWVSCLALGAVGLWFLLILHMEGQEEPAFGKDHGACCWQSTPLLLAQRCSGCFTPSDPRNLHSNLQDRQQVVSTRHSFSSWVSPGMEAPLSSSLVCDPVGPPALPAVGRSSSPPLPPSCPPLALSHKGIF